MLRRTAIGLVLVLLASVPLAAEELKQLRARGFTAITIWDPPKHQRVTLSHWIEAECKVLLDKTPSLSPREKDWLAKERAAGRLMDSYHTPEFSKNFIRENADRCVTNARWIRKATSKPKELAYWGLLIQSLYNDDWKWHVNNVRENGGVTNLTKDHAVTAGLFGTYGDRVFDNIIVPYLVKPIIAPKKKSP